jgi:hypothetical protein
MIYTDTNGNKHQVRVLSKSDWAGYDQNRPTPNWQLVLFEDGTRLWVGSIWLT